MIIPAALLSGIFIGIAFLVTKNNAKYILSGYNMMSEEDRALVDIDGFLRVFKRFHIFLGVSLFVLVAGLTFINENLAAVILGVYPLAAYCYLLFKTRTYFSMVRSQRIGSLIGIAVLLVTLVGVFYLFWNGFRNSTIVLNKETLEITGMYGEKIHRNDLVDVQLVNELPAIKMRSNGFAAGDYRKGYFKTKDRRTVLLYTNENAKPYLMLETKAEKIFFSSNEELSAEIFSKIQEWRQH